jgi:hypothetical protein
MKTLIAALQNATRRAPVCELQRPQAGLGRQAVATARRRLAQPRVTNNSIPVAWGNRRASAGCLLPFVAEQPSATEPFCDMARSLLVYGCGRLLLAGQGIGMRLGGHPRTCSAGPCLDYH